ncbi:MAG TPA: PaaI family thioesterase [Candidatus Hydrogenedentes bacterium]|nr:PaaI family thioesterase [Candidatus Hydrogenedentota bacterium]HIJ74993.1 PaaI family thioesterase [Candidatus Hydrogenedentota bacterium]
MIAAKSKVLAMDPDGKDDRRCLPTSATCFVCGEDNDAGVQTRFYVEDGQVKTELDPKAEHCGYRNVVHGGVVAAVLDECMSWAATYAIGRLCYTADLKLRYLKPVPGDQPIRVAAEVVRANKRLVHATGAVTDASGAVCVRGEGRFVPLSAEETLEVDDYLIYRGGEVRLFDALRQENQPR